MSTILHVDMDAFYASVELRRRPDLIGRPMIVGGSTRGVVLSASYEARAQGVRSGMPMTQARRLSPQAEVIPPDMDSYAAVSRAVMAVFDQFTPVVEAASIDEAFLDVTGSMRLFGSAVQIGETLRAVVADEQQITCSVGIGPNKFVAKLASRSAKPDGLVEVAADQVVEYLHPLPVERLWGVGEATAEKLHRLGLTTVGELAHTPESTLRRAFGPHAGVHLARLAWGRDERVVVARPPERSIGSEQTFARDIDDPVLVRRELLRMADRTAGRLRRAGVLGRTVTVSIRFADFTSLTRSATVSSPTDVTEEIYAQAVAIHARLGLQRARIRRVGVRVEGLVDRDEAYRQPELTEPDHGWREAEQAIDAATRRFGPSAVQRAVLTRRERRGVVEESDGHLRGAAPAPSDRGRRH
ncbi:DNA polymerase IV [Auraticoccus monumenti]|uniref:DNA polymerase IV n=1 Tax=Auraticoccus monumenti TaxID=675864 RepID=A0A1G7DNR4_9ACTN|nr:DNA polymerase IV [Auraticoccus monumenti]SDE53127.1 DNA polymerase-4 [Auraticoccus monumenti]